MNRCAAALANGSLTKGDRLALLSHNCHQFGALAFATARLSVVLVPVNFMLGPTVATILDHSGAKALVTEDALAPTAEKAIAVVRQVAVRARIGAGDPRATGQTPTPGSPATTTRARRTRTSATTTRCASCTPRAPSPGPKGVMLSSRSLITSTRAASSTAG
ncbi:AMP-binding protein [Pseudonocardia sp. MCCB 268]|nr:AMP-binding protein [Pseudonocardia cytotoxica]